MSPTKGKSLTTMPEAYEKLLAVFDEDGFDVACRHMKLMLVLGKPKRAKDVLDAFIRKPIELLTMNSSVSEAFDSYLATGLESAGLLSVRAVDGASDESILQIREIGPDRLATCRSICERIKEGQMVAK